MKTRPIALIIHSIWVIVFILLGWNIISLNRTRVQYEKVMASLEHSRQLFNTKDQLTKSSQAYQYAYDAYTQGSWIARDAMKLWADSISYYTNKIDSLKQVEP